MLRDLDPRDTDVPVLFPARSHRIAAHQQRKAHPMSLKRLGLSCSYALKMKWGLRWFNFITEIPGGKMGWCFCTVLEMGCCKDPDMILRTVVQMGILFSTFSFSVLPHPALSLHYTENSYKGSKSSLNSLPQATAVMSLISRWAEASVALIGLMGIPDLCSTTGTARGKIGWVLWVNEACKTAWNSSRVLRSTFQSREPCPTTSFLHYQAS